MTLWQRFLNFLGIAPKRDVQDMKVKIDIVADGMKDMAKKDTVKVDRIAYEKLSKNDLVGLLWKRGVDHNKRMLKSDLIDLLVEDDKKNLS